MKKKKELSNRIPPGINIVDVSEGTGATAEAGCLVRIRTTGRLNHGDSISRDEQHGDVTEFRIGERSVIAGLERGVLGMRVGGRRHLRIGPHLAYGATGVPGSIPPDAVLVYDVDLLACE